MLADSGPGQRQGMSFVTYMSSLTASLYVTSRQLVLLDLSVFGYLVFDDLLPSSSGYASVTS
jgi:hypothetical protein